MLKIVNGSTVVILLYCRSLYKARLDFVANIYTKFFQNGILHSSITRAQHLKSLRSECGRCKPPQLTDRLENYLHDLYILSLHSHNPRKLRVGEIMLYDRPRTAICGAQKKGREMNDGVLPITRARGGCVCARARPCNARGTRRIVGIEAERLRGDQ